MLPSQNQLLFISEKPEVPYVSIVKHKCILWDIKAMKNLRCVWITLLKGIQEQTNHSKYCLMRSNWWLDLIFFLYPSSQTSLSGRCKDVSKPQQGPRWHLGHPPTAWFLVDTVWCLVSYLLFMASGDGFLRVFSGICFPQLKWLISMPWVQHQINQLIAKSHSLKMFNLCCM